MTLPPMYDRWMTEALGAPVRGEPRSTCSDCAMCPKDPAEPLPHFRPDVKCCGYRPALPNFQVGAVLRDDAHPEGQRTMRARLAEKVSVTPLGVYSSPEYAAAHKQARFGSDPALLCPHFSMDGGGTCTIWAHREAVCSTWFCHTDRGAVGKLFWTSLRDLLDNLQDALAREAAEQVGARPPSGWGLWTPRDEEFFIACADRVRRLTWAEVRHIGGFDLKVRLREVREMFDAREHPVLPERVRRGPAAAHDLPDGRVRFRTGTRYDSLDTDRTVLDVLARAEGPTSDILADGSIDAATLQALVDHGILAPDAAEPDPFAALGR